MKQIALVAILAASAVTAVAAQGNPIAARKALMKENNDHFRNLVRMTRGEAPFEAGKVEAAFAQWAQTAQKLPGLFPDDSKTGDNTRAAPKIWETRADFDEKIAAFAKAVADNRDKAQTLDGLKLAIGPVGRACDNCHEQYRARRQ